MEENSDRSDLKDGVSTVTLSSWKEFHQEAGRHAAGYVWRGQRENWPLKASFDRPGFKDQRARTARLNQNLDDFKAAMNKSFPGALPRNDLAVWALGQQYGLKIPLLDWTLSPYIAAYFAFLEADGKNDSSSGYRYVYGLSKSVGRLMEKLDKVGQPGSSERAVTFIDRLPYHNPRFTAQRGVFTETYRGNDIWRYVQSFAGKRPGKVLVVKIVIPSGDRKECFRDLRLMNIDHTSLLLDFHDVIEYCNKKA